MEPEPVLQALADASERGLLPAGAVLLAVSGGADSLALLYGAAELAPSRGWRLSVGHVHHGLRGREADRDLAFVADHARRLGLPFFCRRRDAARESRRLKLSPEAGARQVRYAALIEMAKEADADRIATAHHRGDRRESHRIARERRAGIAGLAGPRERRDDGVVRPLLPVSREEILAYLRRRAISHRRDASNGNLRLTRNRVRRELSRERLRHGDDAFAALDAAIDGLAAERERVEREFCRDIAPRIWRGPGAVTADAMDLERADPEVARVAIEHVARPFARPGRPPVTGREREEIRRRLASGEDFRFEAGRRIRFERRGRLLTVRPRDASARESV